MPNEPERQIENELRAAARQRSEAAGEPPTLHPATRKLLQDEVAQVYANQRNTGRENRLGLWQKFFGSWPKFALSATMAALLAVAGFFLLPMFSRPKSDAELAKNELLSTPPPAPIAALAPSQLAEKVETLARPASVAQNRPLDIHQSLSLDVKADEPKRGLSGLQDAGSASRFGLETKTDTLAAGTNPVTAPERATSTPIVSQTESGFAGLAGEGQRRAGASGNIIAQQFTRESRPALLARRLAKALGDPPILESFRLEQTGNQIRVIDSDGSIYAGYLEKPENSSQASLASFKAKIISPQDKALENTTRRELAGAKESEIIGGVTQLDRNSSLETIVPPSVAAPTNRFFRVSGTNLSLHQELVFRGRLLMEPASTVTNGIGAGNIQPAAGTPQLTSPTARVEGQVTIGKTNQMEIKARATE